MWKRRRTEITVETDEVFRIRRPGRKLRAWCAGCAAEAWMVTPDEAAVLSGVGTRTIYAFVEAGRLHFMETSGGLLLFVCLNSLLNGRDDNSIRL